MSAVRVFVSHSSRDRILAERLILLLRDALNLESHEILCTSVDGYRLRVGADVDRELLRMAIDADVMIAILSSGASQSQYVAFELGVRLANDKELWPLLAPGMTANDLQSPLKGT